MTKNFVNSTGFALLAAVGLTVFAWARVVNQPAEQPAAQVEMTETEPENTATDRLFDFTQPLESNLDVLQQPTTPLVYQSLAAMAPSVTCPGNITVNLGPGECTAPVSYDVDCVGGSPTGTSGQVSHPLDFNNGNDGIMFDVKNLSDEPMTLTEFGPSLDAGSWTMQVYYTTVDNTWQGNEINPAAWTLAGTQVVNSATPFNSTAVPGFGITIPAGASRGIYLTAIAGSPLNYTGLGVGIQRSYDDGMLRVSSTPGAGKSYFFGSTIQNRAYSGYVKYTTPAPKQLAGLPSGSEFPMGVTTNVFQCTDAMGVTATCSFTVTVVDFPNPVNSLICNDVVTVALGPDCEFQLGADDVLEGGPYKCYDNYLVQVDRFPPYGNGPWLPAVFTSSDLNNSYFIRVYDPSSGNFCTSQVNVVDNFPPEIDCTPTPVYVPCNFDLSPTHVEATEIIQKFTASNTPQTINDNQTKEILIPVTTATGATAVDIDFRTRVNGNPFNGNLEIEIESPSGTVVRVWDQQVGCAGQPLFVRFDDEQLVAFSCPAYTSDQRSRIPIGIDLLSDFDGEPVNGIWKVRYRDVNGGGDVCVATIAELFIKFNATFSTGFPNGLVFPQQVSQLNANSFKVPAPLLDNCSDVTLSYIDNSQPQTCQSGLTAIVYRTWTAKDKSNNTATCVQEIRLVRPSLDDVQLPPNYDDIDEPSFDCDTEYPTPEWVENHGGQGFPYVYGEPTGCSIGWTFTDIVIPSCDGSYTVKRQWAIVDNCTSQIFAYDQIIQVKDLVAPYFDCPADVTVTTNLYNCCATTNLPDIIVEDGCSQIKSVKATIIMYDPIGYDTVAVYQVNGSLNTFPNNNPTDPDTLGVLGNTPCLTQGVHEVIYEVIDDCGNIGTCSFSLTVRDYTPPSANCQQLTTVAIGPDDPLDCYDPNNGCEFGGVAVVPASVFNSGSYDNCGNIKLTVRRAQPYSQCIEDLDQSDCAYYEGKSEYEIATQEADSIKFYCCEVGTTQMVIMRVYQLDFYGNISIGPDGTPIYNECQVEVQVQDKLKPGCTSPANVSVSCENFDPSLWVYGIPTVEDNCCLDTTKVYMGQKGLTHQVSYALFDTVCNRGTITRTFRVYDCHGFTSQCTQRIYVNYEQEFFVKFPDDKVISFCDSSGVYGEPQFFGEDCELLGVSFEDEVFTVVPDACYKIERTWHIINWCTYNPNQPCILVPNPNPNSNTNHPSNLPGPIVSPMGTPQPWAPTNVKINPSDNAPTNYSYYYSTSANCYEYHQIIKITDTQDPVIENCPTSPIEICDLTDNDPMLWNENYWFDFIHGTHDLCEGPADLSVNASDACSGANVQIRYILFLDLDGDGEMETVVSSTNLPPSNTVYYGNATAPNFVGGTARSFDERPVPSNQKYRFAIETKTVNNKKTAWLRWNTVAQPNAFVVPQLPYGTHKIKWIVEDGCGNETICEYAFIIKDCKPPTVACYNGLSINMMPTGMISVFAADFIQWGQDNCTPMNQLIFAIRKSGTGTGFPVDAQGNPITSVNFTCDEVGTQPVELWAMDAAGNAAFCETYVIVQDPFNFCNPGSHTSVAGALLTEGQDGVEETSIELNGSHPSLPDIGLFGLTDQDGEYMFQAALPVTSNYTVTPTKDDNPMNGVSTFDLVLMSKHILGIDPLNSPYKVIAADVNKSNSVTTFDIVELRKLILGIYSELPNNTSWRFIDTEFGFDDPNNPFVNAPFAENKTIANIQADQMHDDFVGIKIGDLNNSVIANANSVAQDRSAGTLLLDTDDRDVKAGETFDVRFTAADKVQGFQFTLTFEGLELAEILPGDGMSLDNFGVFADAITASANGDANTFTLRFRALKSGSLSQMLGLSSRITRAEAYAQNDDLLDVALRFRSDNGTTTSGVGFELYQNQPNPWVHQTQIGFHLPADGQATLTIFDETGRMLHSQTGDFARGYNAFRLEQRLLNSSAGTLRYRVESGSHSATRTMIQTR